jgi:hypothetical protein
MKYFLKSCVDITSARPIPLIRNAIKKILFFLFLFNTPKNYKKIKRNPRIPL